jgi:hypothetical protein
MATSIDGHLLKTVSTPLNRLITEGYNPDGNREWDLVNVGFLQLVLTALQAGVDLDFVEVFDTMGVKLVRQNVALTGLNALPDLPNYMLKNKERVLLIAQTNANQNGFYEWQSGGTLVRLFDWRDVVAGNGIAINANNLALKLWANALNLLQFNSNGELSLQISPNSHPALQKEAGTGFLLLDPLALGGGGGGGGSIIDIPNPDVDEVKRGNGLAVFLPNEVDVLDVFGGCFRSANPTRAEIDCAAGSFNYNLGNSYKHNRLKCTFTSGNAVGSHLLRVRNSSQISNFYHDAQHAITILGAAIINTVQRSARRGQTTEIIVYGAGFAFLSVFSANHPNITIAFDTWLNSGIVIIQVTVANNVLSGAYNLLCTNAFAGLGSFTSGTSGDNKLIVFGSPLITNALGVNSWGGFVEFPLGAVGAELRVNGTDLTDTISLLNSNTGVPDGFTVNSVAGSGTQKVVNFDTTTDKTLIGLRNVFCEDLVTGENSDISGDGLIALNFPFSAGRRAGSWRAYGGADLSDWDFVGNSIEKTGGSGVCYLEMADIFLNPSYVTNQFGLHAADFITFFVANLFSNVVGDVYFILADRGVDVDIADFNSFAVAVKFSFDASNNCLIDYRSFTTNGGVQGSYNYQFRLQSALGLTYTDTYFELASGGATPNSYRAFNAGSHQPQTVHIAMTDNFKINDVYLQGRVGD